MAATGKPTHEWEPVTGKANPRRCPAMLSVSLRPSKSSVGQVYKSASGKNSNPSLSLDSASESHDDARPAILSNQPPSAKNWFDTANANVDEYRVDPFDNDPPFYIA